MIGRFNMIERDKRWKKVGAGDTISAGQPYAVHRLDSKGPGSTQWIEFLGHSNPWRIPSYLANDWYVDSAWVPPVDLPGIRTWGIAITNETDEDPLDWIVDEWQFGKDSKYTDELTLNGYHTASLIERRRVFNFIPLTEDQIALLEGSHGVG